MALRTTIAASFLALTGGALALAQPRPPGVTRADLQRHDLSAPGLEVIQARIDFAPGTRFPSHRHPGEEVIYVLEGTLDYDVEGRGKVSLKAGDVLFVPAGTAHAAANTGTIEASELGTFIVERGKPLVTLASDGK